MSELVFFATKKGAKMAEEKTNNFSFSVFVNKPAKWIMHNGGTSETRVCGCQADINLSLTSGPSFSNILA